MMQILYLVLAGLVSGVVGGMGMGGGTLLIPVLTILLAFEQKNAQAINLLVFIPMAIVALVIHVKNKLVDFNVGIPIVIIGVIFSVVGSLLANNLSNEILRTIFGIFLLMVGLNQAVQTIISMKNKKKDKESSIAYKIRIYIR